MCRERSQSRGEAATRGLENSPQRSLRSAVCVFTLLEQSDPACSLCGADACTAVTAGVFVVFASGPMCGECTAVCSGCSSVVPGARRSAAAGRLGSWKLCCCAAPRRLKVLLWSLCCSTSGKVGCACVLKGAAEMSFLKV